MQANGFVDVEIVTVPAFPSNMLLHILGEKDYCSSLGPAHFVSDFLDTKFCRDGFIIA